MIKVTIEDEKEQKVLEGEWCFALTVKPDKGETRLDVAAVRRGTVIEAMATACVQSFDVMEQNPMDMFTTAIRLAKEIEKLAEIRFKEKFGNNEGADEFCRYMKKAIGKRLYEG